MNMYEDYNGYMADMRDLIKKLNDLVSKTYRKKHVIVLNPEENINEKPKKKNYTTAIICLLLTIFQEISPKISLHLQKKFNFVNYLCIFYTFYSQMRGKNSLFFCVNTH